MITPSVNQGVPGISHTSIVVLPAKPHTVRCAAIPDRVENITSCAIIHRVALNSPFPAAYADIATYIRGVFFPRLPLDKIHWVDIEFEITASRARLYDVSDVQLNDTEGSVVNMVKTPMDLTSHQGWVARAQNAIDLLLNLPA